MTKILIIDDEIDVCDFVKHFFEERNYRVFTALNSDEGLRLLRREKPDIVLLDVRMAGTDGIETLKKIRTFDKRVTVIMVTAVDEQARIDESKKLGAAKYITKPLVLEELEAAVLSYTKESSND